MNELYKAYAVLDLEPGNSLSNVMLQYRRLAKIWHPDRTTDKEQKDFVERKLKQINNAKDVLVSHFTSNNHKRENCECQAIVAANNLSHVHIPFSHSTSHGSRQNDKNWSGRSPGTSVIYAQANEAALTTAIRSWFLLFLILFIMVVARLITKEPRGTGKMLSVSFDHKVIKMSV